MASAFRVEKGQGGKLADKANGFEADGYNLADKSDDVLGIVRAVGVIYDAGAFVGGDAILIDDPFEGASVAEAVFVDFGRGGALCKQLPLLFYLHLGTDTF
jgi:hypothetical protein